MRTRKLTVCQMKVERSSPSVAATSFIRVPVPSAPRAAPSGRARPSGDSLWQDERDDERVDRDSLGEAKTNQHRRQDRAADVRVAADRLHRLTNTVADTQARPDSPQANRQRGCPMFHEYPPTV